jgi:hypothetical protein
MIESRLAALEQALLRAGIARRSVRRAKIEVADHFAQLREAAIARGADAIDAESEAHALLGTNQAVIERYASRPELKALWMRRPALWFALAPVAVYFAVCASTLAGIVLLLTSLKSYLHSTHFSPQVSLSLEFALRFLISWVFPTLVACAFFAVARRRGLPLHWLWVGIASLSVFAACVNVRFALTGGPSPGEIGAGLGLSTETWLTQLARAAGVAALMFVPTWLVGRGAGRALVSGVSTE